MLQLGFEIHISPKHVGQAVRRIVRARSLQEAQSQNCTMLPSNSGPVHGSAHGSAPMISQVLRLRRSLLGLAQDDVASMAGTHPKLIRECESGKRDIRLGTLERICDVLDLEVQVIPKHLGQIARRITRAGLQGNGQSENSV